MSTMRTVWLLRGVAAFFGGLALLALVTGKWGLCFGMVVFCLFWAGSAWATRRMRFPTPAELDSPRGTVATIVLVMFGGAGVVMLVGAILFLFDGESDAALGVGIFGAIFCGIGYLGRRAFSVPEGMREVAVQRGRRTIRSGGRVLEIEHSTHTLIDSDTSPAQVAEQQQKWAEQPWTQRADWVAGRIANQGVLPVATLGGFTVAWNVFAWFLTGAFLWDRDAGFPWLVGVFPLVGLVLAVLTFRSWIHKRKFGTSTLVCASVPCWLGGRFEGTLRIEGATKSLGGCRVSLRLACLRKITHRQTGAHASRSNDYVSTKVLWEHSEDRMAPASSGLVLEVPIDLAIPSDQPPTVMAPEDDRTLWRVHASCRVPGVDYTAAFEIPVFPHPAGREVGA